MSTTTAPALLSTRVYGVLSEDVSRVPEAGRLYIGGLDVLDNPDLLRRIHVTHILSILEFDYCDYEEYSAYDRLLIRAEDYVGQDLLRHFDATNNFIDRALGRDDGVVLVHCAMGQSRSATVVCAYLMWKRRLSAQDALSLLQKRHAEAQPNDGFMRQLEVYAKVLQVDKQANTVV